MTLFLRDLKFLTLTVFLIVWGNLSSAEETPQWSQWITHQAERFASEDWHMDDPDKKIPYFEMYSITALYVGFGFTVWWPVEDRQSFHYEDEPTWSCSRQYAGCSDRVGHAFYNYLSVDLLYDHLRHTMRSDRALNYAYWITNVGFLLIEVGDGFHYFGFEQGDMVANVLGSSFAYARRYYQWEDLLLFKYTYKMTQQFRESDENHYDIFQDYSGHIARLQLLPSGMSSNLSKHWDWALPEIFYNTYGYLPEDDNFKARNLGVALSFNFPKLIQTLGWDDSGLLGKFLDYFQPPCTSIGIHTDLEHPKSGWSAPELQCGVLSFSTEF